MATGVKILKDERFRIPFGIQDRNGTWISGPIQGGERRNLTTSSGIRNRPKPVGCFDVTGFEFRNTWSNGTQYHVPYAGVHIRVGDLAVVTSTPFRTIAENSGDGSDALQRARAKFNEDDFGETLVEFGETVGLVNKRMRDLYKGFKALKDGDFRKLGQLWKNREAIKKVSAMKASKRLADGYLEFQFGWMPLVSDIYSAVDAYSRGLKSKGDRVRKRSGNYRPRNDDGSTPLESVASAQGIVENPLAANLNALGVLNPLLMAWQKLPFSFLVDWLFNISTVLGSLTAGIGLRCYTQSVTTVTRSKTVGAVMGAEAINGHTTIGTRFPSIGVPILPPKRDGANTLGKQVSLLALFRQLAGGGR